MGIFSIIETFIFFSLAISFILILLLVYHFKDRMTKLEQKTDTMVGIINDIAKELSFVRNGGVMNGGIGLSPASMMSIPMSMPFMVNISGPGSRSEQEPVMSDKVEDVTKDGDEDDDDDNDDDNDDDDDDNDDDNDDDDESILYTGEEWGGEDPDKYEDDPPLPEDSYKKIVVTEDPMWNDQMSGNRSEEDVSEPSPAIVVDTIASETSSPSLEEKESYRKMNLQTLKHVVVSKGLAQDPSKMKKGELLQLLGVNTVVI